MRKKYYATSLPSVWQEVKVNETVDKSWGTWFLSFWPVGGFWGIWKAIQSGQYLIARNSTWKLGIETAKYDAAACSGRANTFSFVRYASEGSVAQERVVKTALSLFNQCCVWQCPNIAAF